MLILEVKNMKAKEHKHNEKESMCECGSGNESKQCCGAGCCSG